MRTSRHSFSSVEQLEELPRELGWSLEYRQLEPGIFASTLTDIEGDAWFLIEELSNCAVEIVAQAPADMFVLALVDGDPAVVNGQFMNSDSVLIQSPDSALRAIRPARTSVMQVGVEAGHFEDIVRTAASELSIARGDVSLFATARGRLAGVRRALAEMLLAPPGQKTAQQELLENILADATGLVGAEGARPVSRSLHGSTAERSLRKAREYIEAHLDDSIRVTGICRYAGTTLRTLERIFAKEVGMSPQQYVKVRRLNAVRRQLLTTERDETPCIRRIAKNHGFTHAGRFAGDYRRHFGESPRETLRSH